MWSSPGDLSQPPRCILRRAGPAWYFFGAIPSSPCCSWRISTSMPETGGCSASLQKTSSPLIPTPKHKTSARTTATAPQTSAVEIFFPIPAFFAPLEQHFFFFFFFFGADAGAASPRAEALCVHTRHETPRRAKSCSEELGFGEEKQYLRLLARCSDL